MKIKGFVIAQAYKKTDVGVKGDGLSDNFFKVYADKEEAYAFLSQVVQSVKRQIKYGVRGKDNLDKDTQLDFCVTECEVEIPEDKMLERGWTV